jgi:DnaA family protein
LPLALWLPPPPGLATFVADGNEALFAALEAWAGGTGERYLYLHGEPGSGKTALLQGAVEQAISAGRRVLYLPLDAPGIVPVALTDLDHLDALALDALDAVAGNPDWELALFSLYNQLAASGTGLLLAGRVPAAQLPVALPDLRSRLSAGAGWRVRPLDEAGCARLLTAGAGRLGLALSRAAVGYILTRCPRDPASLTRLLARLDRATLAAGRAPTVQFIARLLGSPAGAPD